VALEDAPLKLDQEIKKDRGNRCSTNWCRDRFHNVLLAFIKVPFFISKRRDRRCKFKNFHGFCLLFWL